MNFDDIRFRFTRGEGADFEGYTPRSWWALAASAAVGTGSGIDAKRVSFSGSVFVPPDVTEDLQWRIILRHLLLYGQAAREVAGAIEEAWRYRHLGSPLHAEAR